MHSFVEVFLPPASCHGLGTVATHPCLPLASLSFLSSLSFPSPPFRSSSNLLPPSQFQHDFFSPSCLFFPTILCTTVLGLRVSYPDPGFALLSFLIWVWFGSRVRIGIVDGSDPLPSTWFGVMVLSSTFSVVPCLLRPNMLWHLVHHYNTSAPQHHSLGYANLEVAPFVAASSHENFRSGISDLSFNICGSAACFELLRVEIHFVPLQVALV